MFRQDDQARKQNDLDQRDGWTSPMHAERMIYPAEWCLRIQKILQASNECYPSEQRTFLVPFIGQQTQNSNLNVGNRMQVWQKAFLPKL